MIDEGERSSSTYLHVRGVERCVAADAFVNALYGEQVSASCEDRETKRAKRRRGGSTRTHLLRKVLVILARTSTLSTLLPDDLCEETTSTNRRKGDAEKGEKDAP